MDCRAKLGHHNIRSSKLSWQEIVLSFLIIMFEFFFIGAIYSSIFQSLIDVQNLLDLLSESPDIVDEYGNKIITAP